MNKKKNKQIFLILLIIFSLLLSQPAIIEAEDIANKELNAAENVQADNKIEFQQVLKSSHTVVSQSPKTVEEFERILLYMVKNDKYTLKIPYNDTWPNSTNCFVAVNEAFDSVSEKYPEYFSFFNTFNINPQSNRSNKSANKYLTELELTIYHNEFTNEEIIKMKSEFFDGVEKKLEELINTGQLSLEMTDREKAKVLYEWIAIHNSYDTDYAKESYTGYGLVVNNKAVCHGYTAAYNLMCKMVGIPEIKGVFGIIGDSDTINHIWTRANLDGETLFIDSTWGDPIPDEPGYCDFSYFAVDAKFLSENNHKWDDN